VVVFVGGGVVDEPKHETIYPEEDFEILNVKVSREEFEAILNSFHLSKQGKLPFPLMNFFFHPSLDYDDNTDLYTLWGRWHDSSEIPPGRDYEVGEITIVKTGKKRVNLIGHCNPATEDSVTLFRDFWAHLEKSLGRSPLPKTTPMPQKPTRKDNLDLWFDYMYQSKETGIKVTLKTISEEVNLSYDYVRHKHLEYKAEKGIK
jgi:hypothetical protein